MVDVFGLWVREAHFVRFPRLAMALFKPFRSIAVSSEGVVVFVAVDEHQPTFHQNRHSVDSRYSIPVCLADFHRSCSSSC